MTQTGKLMEARNKIEALAVKLRDTAGRLNLENVQVFERADALRNEATGLDRAVKVIDGILAS